MKNERARLCRLGLLLLATISGCAAAGVEPLSNAQAECLQSGSGDQFLKVCWSDHGNITSFESPQGVPHLPLDGYAVCYGTGSGQVAWDARYVESGWGPATLSADKKVVTRKTTDGKLLLKQTFSRNPAEKELSIKMELKNISLSPVFVTGFARYFDADVDGTAGDYYSRTADSVIGFGTNGVSLTAITDLPVATVHVWNQREYEKCEQAGIQVPTGFGNYAGRVFIPMGFYLLPNVTENATFVYRRF